MSLSEIIYSDQQQKIFDFFLDGEGNGVVVARAGAGKTSTIVEAVKRLVAKFPGVKVLVCAFNKSIQTEIQGRLPAGVDCVTLHSLGYKALMRLWGYTKPNAKRDLEIIREVVPYDTASDIVQDLRKLVSLCMNTLTDKPEDIESLMDGYDCGPSPDIDREIYVKWAMKALELNRKKSPVISFDQMVYVPAYNNSATGKYDFVIVDETQDMNASQLVLARNALKDNGRFIAVGDPRQCIATDEQVHTPTGIVLARNLKIGDKVISYRNGKNVSQEITAVVPTGIRHAVRITTKNGHALTMSCSHKIWSTPPTIDKPDQHLVYLMYRPDKGFRIGITNRGYDKDTNKYGNHLTSEGASRLWIIDKCDNREDALLREIELSLCYQIPTLVFNGTNRGLNQERIDTVFNWFGRNGLKLLKEKNYQFEFPHWKQRSGTSQSHERRIVNVVAHGKSGTNVSFEGLGLDSQDLTNKGHTVHVRKKGGGHRIRTWFNKHNEAEAYANKLANDVGGSILWRLNVVNHEPLQLINAAALLVGMAVAVRKGDSIFLDRIVDITQLSTECVDIEVTDANNFYAGTGPGILSHNSIYGFRGATANSMEHIMTEMQATELRLSITYRCPKAVVTLANEIVPDLEAAATAPEGAVSDCTESEFLKGVVGGDFVLSRKNAPLAKYCLKMLALGKPAFIQGKEIGAGLQALVKRSKRKNIEEFLAWLNTWRMSESKRLTAANREEAIDALTDKVEAMFVLSEGLSTTDELVYRIGKLFEEGDPKNRIMFSSVHKAKGMEARRVWCLNPTFKPGKNVEEDNLCYVAWTRAQTELMIVDAPRKNNDD